MITLAAVKSELGIISTSANDDRDLFRAIRQVVYRIRQKTDRGIAWLTDKIEQVDADVHIRVIGHGLRTGSIVKINGSNCTPNIDGEKTLVRISEDIVALTGTSITEPGDFASIHPKATREVRAQFPTKLWLPEQITPCLEIESIYDRQSDYSWIQVDAADYEIPDDPQTNKAVHVFRKNGIFTMAKTYKRGQWALRSPSTVTTAKVTVFTGAPVVPEEIVMAGLSMMSDVWERSGRGKDEASFSFEGASRSVMTGEERREHLLSPDAIMASWLARK